MFIMTKEDISRFLKEDTDRRKILHILDLPFTPNWSWLYNYLSEDSLWKMHDAYNMGYYNSEDDYLRDIRFFCCQKYSLDGPIFDKIWNDSIVQHEVNISDKANKAQHLCRLVACCFLERKNIENWKKGV